MRCREERKTGSGMPCHVRLVHVCVAVLVLVLLVSAVSVRRGHTRDGQHRNRRADFSGKQSSSSLCGRWRPSDCVQLECANESVRGNVGDGGKGGGGGDAHGRNALSEACACYTPTARRVPTVFVIGCQKCGSTSLHTAITNHRDVIEARDVARRMRINGKKTHINVGIAGKELHFFDNANRFRRGLGYYLCHFPPRSMHAHNNDKTRHVVSIDSTPDYLSVPWVPVNIRNMYIDFNDMATHENNDDNGAPRISDARFIIIIREQVRLWLSHECTSRAAILSLRRTVSLSLTIYVYTRAYMCVCPYM